jgi:hypothetical protein
MIDRSPFANRETYVAIRKHLNAVVDSTRVFPDQVFKGSNGSDVVFTEAPYVISPGFWESMKDLARLHGDDHILLLVLDPSNDDYYYPEFGVYFALSLSIHASVEEYVVAVTCQPDPQYADSILFTANRIAVSGASGTWALYSERGPDLDAMWSALPRSEIRRWLEGNPGWLNVVDAIEIASIGYSHEKDLKNFAASLLSNYGQDIAM